MQRYENIMLKQFLLVLHYTLSVFNALSKFLLSCLFAGHLIFVLGIPICQKSHLLLLLLLLRLSRITPSIQHYTLRVTQLLYPLRVTANSTATLHPSFTHRRDCSVLNNIHRLTPVCQQPICAPLLAVLPQTWWIPPDCSWRHSCR